MRVFLLTILVVASTGCLHSKAGSIEARAVDPAAVKDAGKEPQSTPRESGKNAFAPKSLRIYPLTRIETDAKGRRVVCYVEFKDAWGDTTKTTGTLTVSLYRPLAGVEPGMERQERQWVIDLNDLEKNALLFDPATRTYRLTLRDLPDWLTPTSPALVRVSIRVDGASLQDDLRLNQ